MNQKISRTAPNFDHNGLPHCVNIENIEAWGARLQIHAEGRMSHLGGISAM